MSNNRTAMIRGTAYKLAEKPLWWQVAGLQQTATGYGKKLTTTLMVTMDKRDYRVYATCYSNCATLYIERKGEQLIVNL